MARPGPEDLPETRYAWAGDICIAYQVMGEGGGGRPDLIMVPGIVSHVEFFHEMPQYTAFIRGCSSFARVIAFDKRGQGLSDSITGSPSLEERMEDLRAVMDAVGIERTALLGISEGCAMSALFAATYPEAVAKLILYGGFARFTKAADYPHMRDIDVYLRSVRYWGTGASIKSFAPSLADDADIRALWAKGEKLITTPSAYKRNLETNARIDVRSVLPNIQTPTLVLHREGDTLIPVENGRYLADHIPNAMFRSLPGQDHAMFAGDNGPIAAAVEEFLTGKQESRVDVDRILATVLFTDIVGSSQKLAELGDRKWREMLDAHDQAAGQEIERHRGALIKTTGDGILATFDGPGRGVNCAHAIGEKVRGLGLDIRAGLHIGEVEKRGDDVSGLAVHVAARVMDKAGPGEVLVTRTITDLVAGSGLAFEARGEQQLKGIPGDWALYASAG